MNFRIGDGPTTEAAALTALFTTFSFSIQASSVENGAEVAAVGEEQTLEDVVLRFSSSEDDSLVVLSGNK